MGEGGQKNKRDGNVQSSWPVLDDFEDGERGHQPRNAARVETKKGNETDFPQEPLERNAALPIPWLWPEG